MIYTCTISPSLDYTTYLDRFEVGSLNRTSDVYYYPGGKGINVSRVLARLGTGSKALGFTGGFTGQYIEDFLKEEGIETDFIKTDGITRINVKIKTGVETELNGPGPELDAQQLMQLKKKVEAMQQGDWLVLAGSLTGSIAPDYFTELAALCQKQHVRFVVDTSGPALKDLIRSSPFLIKPNLEELGELFGQTIAGPDDALSYARELNRMGIGHVVVSMGGQGALLVADGLALLAEAPQGKAVNTVGAGDSLVSGFIASYALHEDAERAFRYGVASGSATAFSTDLCTKEAVEDLLGKVKITPIQEKDVAK